VELEDGLPVTEAQWVEHSEAWRWAHLEQAPSASLRRQAIEAHEHGDVVVEEQHWGRLPLHTAQMLVFAVVVVVVVIGAAWR
jgi:hypothetical protein